MSGIYAWLWVYMWWVYFLILCYPHWHPTGPTWVCLRLTLMSKIKRMTVNKYRGKWWPSWMLNRCCHHCLVFATPPNMTSYPTASMCGIFTYAWLISMVNAGRYTTHGCYECEKDSLPWPAQTLRLQFGYLKILLAFGPTSRQALAAPPPQRTPVSLAFGNPGFEMVWKVWKFMECRVFLFIFFRMIHYR